MTRTNARSENGSDVDGVRKINTRDKRTGMRRWAALRLCAGMTLAAIIAFSMSPFVATGDPPASATAPALSDAAESFLKTLSDEQRDTVVYEFDASERLEWHFIPKNERKGLQIRDMNDDQQAAALNLLRQSLSEVGYSKATKIMELESLLAELEKDRRGAVRDPERYYFTIFGDASSDDRWGLSIEGHHLSLNFVIEQNSVVSSTPAFFAANPATVKQTVGDFEAGLRVLGYEEVLAFELVQSLNDSQREHAIFAEEAPSEIRAAGEAQAPTDEPIGIEFGQLNDDQQELLIKLIRTYAEAMPEDVAAARLDDIQENGGFDALTFAWGGADEPGIGHYYRVEGPTMLIEFVNTQPDAAGNPANHIHCVWRDPRGDFGLPNRAQQE